MAVDTLNSLFFVQYKPLNHTFSCWFVGRYENKLCEVTYGPVDPTDQLCALDNQVIRRVNHNIISDTVAVFLPQLEHTDSEFCFTAIGKTEAFTVAIEGTFKTGIKYTRQCMKFFVFH